MVTVRKFNRKDKCLLLGISTCWQSGAVPCTVVCHIPIHFSVEQGRCEPCWAGGAHVVWGYWPGKKHIFVLPVSDTPSSSLHPPAAFLQTLPLFTKQIKFSSRFSSFFRIGFKRWRRWSNENPRHHCLWTDCRNKGMNSALLCSGPTWSSKGWDDFPLDSCTTLWWWNPFGAGAPAH